jgi:16S rRNA processing protein RimM
MAVIGGPHGVRGEVRVKPFTEDPLALGEYGPLCDSDGHEFTVAGIRQSKTVVVVRFKEVVSREQAESLSGMALFIDRSALAGDLDEEEFYHSDLIGLRVVDETGAALGNVGAVHDFGGGDILEIVRSDGVTVMVPFSRAAVPEVDLERGVIRIESAAAGLLEEEQEDHHAAGASANSAASHRSRGPHRVRNAGDEK